MAVSQRQFSYYGDLEIGKKHGLVRKDPLTFTPALTLTLTLSLTKVTPKRRVCFGFGFGFGDRNEDGRS
jgi:hypothetical protein